MSVPCAVSLGKKYNNSVGAYIFNIIFWFFRIVVNNIASLFEVENFQDVILETREASARLKKIGRFKTVDMLVDTLPTENQYKIKIMVNIYFLGQQVLRGKSKKGQNLMAVIGLYIFLQMEKLKLQKYDISR